MDLLSSFLWALGILAGGFFTAVLPGLLLGGLLSTTQILSQRTWTLLALPIACLIVLLGMCAWAYAIGTYGRVIVANGKLPAFIYPATVLLGGLGLIPGMYSGLGDPVGPPRRLLSAYIAFCGTLSTSVVLFTLSSPAFRNAAETALASTQDRLDQVTWLGPLLSSTLMWLLRLVVAYFAWALSDSALRKTAFPRRTAFRATIAVLAFGAFMAYNRGQRTDPDCVGDWEDPCPSYSVPTTNQQRLSSFGLGISLAGIPLLVAVCRHRKRFVAATSATAG